MKQPRAVYREKPPPKQQGTAKSSTRLSREMMVGIEMWPETAEGGSGECSGVHAAWVHAPLESVGVVEDVSRNDRLSW